MAEMSDFFSFMVKVLNLKNLDQYISVVPLNDLLSVEPKLL